MSSPVKLDGTEFALNTFPINRFVSLGSQRGNKGIIHTLFLSKTPIHHAFFVGDSSKLSGYCSYRFVYNNNISILIGVLFFSPHSMTVVSDYALSIGNLTSGLPSSFEPSFVLEKNTGIILFKADDSSILAIPSDVTSSLLIKTV